MLCAHKTSGSNELNFCVVLCGELCKNIKYSEIIILLSLFLCNVALNYRKKSVDDLITNTQDVFSSGISQAIGLTHSGSASGSKSSGSFKRSPSPSNKSNASARSSFREQYEQPPTTTEIIELVSNVITSCYIYLCNMCLMFSSRILSSQVK